MQYTQDEVPLAPADAAPDIDAEHPVPLDRTATDAILAPTNPAPSPILKGIKPLSATHDATLDLLRQNLSLGHLPTTEKPRSRLRPGERASLLEPQGDGLKTLQDMRSKEYITFNRKFFQDAWHRENQSLEELSPYRIRAIYRVVRHMAEMRGLCNSDEMLSQAFAVSTSRKEESAHLCPYDTPTAPTDIYLYKHLGPMYGKFLSELFNIPVEDMVWFKNLNPLTHKDYPILQKLGLPLHPPPVPLHQLHVDDYSNTIQVKPTYDPYEDKALRLFMDEVRMVVDYLQIAHGTFKDPNSGFLGLQGILSYDLIRAAWPTKTEILAYEFIMVEDVMMKIVKKGIRTARELTEQEYGCNLIELDGLMRMARDMAKRVTEQSIEDDRAIATLRMEAYIERAAEALDLKSEMNAHKQLAMITGLTRAEADNEMKDMLDVVKRVSSKAARKATEKALTNNAQKMLAQKPVAK